MPEICPGPSPTIADVDPNDLLNESDWVWHMSPAHPHVFCGGCGMDATHCHPGFCCTEVVDPFGVLDSVCGLCADRHDGYSRRAPKS